MSRLDYGDWLKLLTDIRPTLIWTNIQGIWMDLHCNILSFLSFFTFTVHNTMNTNPKQTYLQLFSFWVIYFGKAFYVFFKKNAKIQLPWKTLNPIISTSVNLWSNFTLLWMKRLRIFINQTNYWTVLLLPLLLPLVIHH